MIEPIWLLKYLPNMLACHISILIDCQGPSNTITEAEASSNLAIAEAARIIARGRADVMITGGADSKIHPLSLVRMACSSNMSRWKGDPRQACRPVRPPPRRLGPRRRGGHPDPRRARARLAARGARSMARSSASARAATRSRRGGLDPEGSGTEIAITAALREAGLEPADDRPRQRPRLGDQGLRPRRGPGLQPGLRRRRPVPVTALKGYMGNLVSGCGAVELIAQPDRRQSRRDSRRSSTATSPIPACELDLVLERAATDSQTRFS